MQLRPLNTIMPSRVTFPCQHLIGLRFASGGPELGNLVSDRPNQHPKIAADAGLPGSNGEIGTTGGCLERCGLRLDARNTQSLSRGPDFPLKPLPGLEKITDHRASKLSVLLIVKNGLSYCCSFGHRGGPVGFGFASGWLHQHIYPLSGSSPAS